MPKKKHPGPNSVGQHANSLAQQAQAPAAPLPQLPPQPPPRTPLINLAVKGQLVGTVGISRVPCVGEYLGVKSSSPGQAVGAPMQMLRFIVTGVTHFPPDAGNPNYVDAEVALLAV